ncbi:MAG: hypothetical protein V3V23_07670 [Dehalococcoidales bacterium]
MLLGNGHNGAVFHLTPTKKAPATTVSLSSSDAIVHRFNHLD